MAEPLRHEPVARLVEIQQRAIRRSARWWMDATERLQIGDLTPSSWIGAQQHYLDGLWEDVGDTLAVIRCWYGQDATRPKDTDG